MYETADGDGSRGPCQGPVLFRLVLAVQLHLIARREMVPAADERHTEIQVDGTRFALTRMVQVVHATAVAGAVHARMIVDALSLVAVVADGPR